MQVHSIIQPSATVIRITELAPGSIYQRLIKSTYSGDKDRVVFGVVTSILSNGEDAAITSLEFTPPMYGGSIEPEIKVFSGGSDVALFPATDAEWTAHMVGAIEKQEREVVKVEESLFVKRAVLNQMQSALTNPRSLAITAEVTPEVEA